MDGWSAAWQRLAHGQLAQHRRLPVRSPPSAPPSWSSRCSSSRTPAPRGRGRAGMGAITRGASGRWWLRCMAQRTAATWARQAPRMVVEAQVPAATRRRETPDRAQLGRISAAWPQLHRRRDLRSRQHQHLGLGHGRDPDLGRADPPAALHLSARSTSPALAACWCRTPDHPAAVDPRVWRPWHHGRKAGSGSATINRRTASPCRSAACGFDTDSAESPVTTRRCRPQDAGHAGKVTQDARPWPQLHRHPGQGDVRAEDPTRPWRIHFTGDTARTNQFDGRSP